MPAPGRPGRFEGVTVTGPHPTRDDDLDHYQTHHVKGADAAAARAVMTRLPPPLDGPFMHRCDVCGAMPGKWCVGTFTPSLRGELLRDPHDARVKKWKAQSS